MIRPPGTLTASVHTMIRRFVLLWLVLAVSAAACGWDASEEVTTTTEPSPTTSASSTSTTTTEAETTTTEAAPSTTAAALDDDLPLAYVELVSAVEATRGLEFLSVPGVSVVSEEELARLVREEFDESVEPGDLAVDEALFELLGLLDGSIDLAAAYEDLLAEQVAGFYDSDTGEMVVGGSLDLTPMTRFILFHELVHALTDQHFGFGAAYDELIDQERYHEAAAMQALVEGDATYFQLVYFQSLPRDEQLEVIEESLAIETPVTDALPDWFSADLGFPYDTGFRFVERIVSDSGIAGVDQAYRLVPTTTEQVIHPDAYLRFEPARPVEVPDLAVEGYEVYESGTLGEWNLDLMVLDGASDGDAVVASAGWGGDEYVILWNGEEVAFVLVYAGDTPGDAEEFADAAVEALTENMNVGSALPGATEGTTVMTGGDYAFVGLDGATVVVVAAADVETGSILTEQAFSPEGD